jgi:peptidoglycan/LPS O-acetylase OafA/YrhL
MRRLPELDGLRGLAALTIVAYHYRPQTFFFGWAAVDLFFVLSGYLITSIILHHEPSPQWFRAFYARRILRIWPIYYLTLFALLAVTPLMSQTVRLDALPYYLTFTQNIQHYWFGALPPFTPKFAHTWTLAIEEQFYLFWPLLVMVAGRKRLAPLCLGLVVVAAAGRALGFDSWLLLTRCDGFGLGALLAVIFCAGALPFSSRPARTGILAAAVVTGASVLAAGAMVHGPHSLLSPVRPPWPSATLLAINLAFCGCVGLSINYAGSRALKPLRSRVLCYLGKVSYGLYLYHTIVFWLVDRIAARIGVEPSPMLGAVKLLGGFAAAAASWHFIERPILALKERFPYRAEGGPASASTKIRPKRLRGAVAGS